MTDPHTLTVQVQAGQVQGAGGTLAVRAGDTLRFVLPTTPGTGYSWLALEVNPEYLTFVGKESGLPPAAPTGMVGGPGPDLIYTYRVRKALTQGGSALALPVGFVQLPPGRQLLPQLPAVLYYLTPCQ